MKVIAQTEFAGYFLNNTTWIDVRAPIEFLAGSVPGAINLPLINDSERHQIGLTYKTLGQNAAVDLGHNLVSGELRETRILAWIQALQQNPNAILFCFRGGLRSQITQSWLQERGIDRPIVAGGYKALRQFLLTTIAQQTQKQSFLVISGPTGSGKTQYLAASGKPYVDLEALANHRGSAFGAHSSPQPTQIDFENRLALALLKLQNCNEPILIESESRMIGQCCIPQILHTKMKISPRLSLQVPMAERVENIFKEYILHSPLGERADSQHFNTLRQSVIAISRKLGGVRSQEIIQDLNTAEQLFNDAQSLDENRIWIRKLLEWYYDPLYPEISMVTNFQTI